MSGIQIDTKSLYLICHHLSFFEIHLKMIFSCSTYNFVYILRLLGTLDYHRLPCQSPESSDYFLLLPALAAFARSET